MNTKKFIWFGNDADGLSMVDVLTSVVCIFYMIFKVFHIMLSIQYMDKSTFIIQLNFIMQDITSFMNMIIIFYFSKKTIDTTVTKIGLFKAGEYSNVTPQINDDTYTEPTNDQETTTSSNSDEESKG